MLNVRFIAAHGIGGSGLGITRDQDNRPQSTKMQMGTRSNCTLPSNNANLHFSCHILHILRPNFPTMFQVKL